jgi:uncharacterized coiled-coil DUF342 family protein
VDVNEFKALKSEFDQVNNSISRISGQMDGYKTSLREIFSRYGVKSLKELKELHVKRQGEAEAVMQEVQTYVSEMQDKIAEVEKLLAS